MSRFRIVGSALAAMVLVAAFHRPAAGRSEEATIRAAEDVLAQFLDLRVRQIPASLLSEAHGVAIIPDLIKVGFVLGGQRGKGVVVVRQPDGSWRAPTFVTLTGGSIGWQFGAESTDVVLVFANERSIRNIESGKFTLGGDATAVAGPLDKRSTKAVTFKSEVYVYAKSRGLFAGAAFEGARLDIDQEGSAAFYGPPARPLEAPMAGTPASVQPFLQTLQQAAASVAAPRPGNAHPGPGVSRPAAESEEAVTFPLE